MERRTPALKRAGVLQNDGMIVRSASDRSAGDVADIAAVDAEIAEFAVGHATKFGNRLTVLAPVVQAACYVHDDPLS
jgi:hypothetical protein